MEDEFRVIVVLVLLAAVTVMVSPSEILSERTSLRMVSLVAEVVVVVVVEYWRLLLDWELELTT